MYNIIDLSMDMDKCFKIQLKNVQARNTCGETTQIFSLDD